MKFKLTILAPVAAATALFLPSCISAPSSRTEIRSAPESSAAQKQAEDPKKDKLDPKAAQELELKIARLERDLNMARHRLERARVDVQNQELNNRDSLTRAKSDLELARKALAQYNDFDSKIRIERGKLGMQQMEDGLQEMREELDQILSMYKDNEIADKTKEIVVRRNQRRLERLTQNAQMQKEEFENLMNKTIPLERAKLELELDAKERAMQAAERGARDGMADREIGVMGAESEVFRVESELASAKKEHKS
ncbi:MAG: hypothetical protein HY286_07300 [Planctomycetes bacterium]|nr:hypothetical protein [Planctomycetota bacterium]